MYHESPTPNNFLSKKFRVALTFVIALGHIFFNLILPLNFKHHIFLYLSIFTKFIHVDPIRLYCPYFLKSYLPLLPLDPPNKYLDWAQENICTIHTYLLPVVTDLPDVTGVLPDPEGKSERSICPEGQSV